MADNSFYNSSMYEIGGESIDNNFNEELVDNKNISNGVTPEGFIQSTLKERMLSIISEMDADKLQSYLNELDDQSEKKLILDQSFKEVLLGLIKINSKTASYQSFIDFMIACVHQNIISQSVLFSITMDFFDMINLDVCSEMFSYIDEKIDIWKSEIMHKTCKNYFLRMCNDLLKKLSTTTNTIFCGKIQLFLARLFSIEEKSGLNLMSNFNTENVTLFNNNSEPNIVNSIDEDGNETIPVDFNLYKKFWSLQHCFNKPTDCYNESFWSNFKENSEEVLNCFESFRLSDDEVFLKNDARSESFSAKYLTSEKLFNLQLRDGNLRRHVLVQFIILFQYLTSEVKFKLVNQILTEEQAEWVKNAKEKVLKLLLETPPDAENFVKTVDFLLNSENKWNSWKNNGCPSYIKDKNQVDAPVINRKRKRSMCSDLKTNSKLKNLGNPNISKLWNTESKINGDPFPKLETFFVEAIEQLDPANGVEDQYLLVNDVSFAWKSRRVLSRYSTHLYDSVNKCTNTNLKEILNKMSQETRSPTNDLEEKEDNSTDGQSFVQAD